MNYFVGSFQKQTAERIVSLEEAKDAVRMVASDENPANRRNGELIYIMARLYTDEPLTEPDYNIQVQAVKLKRQVQMYQWVEEESYVCIFNMSIILLTLFKLFIVFTNEIFV